jgi:hypothetical protein
MAPRLLTVSLSTELDEAELEMMDLVGSTPSQCLYSDTIIKNACCCVLFLILAAGFGGE